MKQTCQKCHGARFYYAKLRDLSGRTPGTPSVVEHYLSCDMCDGKGYTDQSDHNRYLRGMGVSTNMEAEYTEFELREVPGNCGHGEN